MVPKSKDFSVNKHVFNSILTPFLSDDDFYVDNQSSSFFLLMEIQLFGKLYVNEKCDFKFHIETGILVSKNYLKEFFKEVDLNVDYLYSYDNQINWFSHFGKLKGESDLDILLEANSQIKQFIGALYNLRNRLEKIEI